jgi:DNA-binding transcriptional ArsR family regulator
MSALPTETLLSLLKLSSRLQKTLLASQMLGLATASDIAKQTGRARAVESSYLNQLTTKGLIKKIPDGRKIYFRRERK